MSSGSYFFDEAELEKYEENIQTKINEIWANIQSKQDDLQNDFQTELESIYEECASLKFEKIAEIKFMYKNQTDPDKVIEKE